MFRCLFWMVSMWTCSLALAQETVGSNAPINGTNPAGSAGAGAGMGASLMMWGFLAVLVVMLVMSMRRESKTRKKQQSFLDSLQVGQEVITASGLIGKIHIIADTTVVLDLGDTKVKMVKSMIHQPLNAETSAVKA